MAHQEYEPTPSEISPTQRFYSDIHYKSESYVDLLISAERLLRTEGVYDENEPLDHLYGSILPTAAEYEEGRAEALDKFLLIPMNTLAPHYDETKELDALNDWYSLTIEFILKHTKGVHTEKCLEQPVATQSMACKESRVCPLIYTAEYLKRPVVATDFTEFNYIVDYERQYQLALMKMRIAQRFSLEYEHYGNTLIHHYQKGYHLWFGSLPKA